MANRTPLMVVVAGPNGAGKSTTAPSLLRDALAVSEFVNADEIAAGLSALRPESAALAAGRIMLTRLRALSGARQDFAFETTLASRSISTSINRVRATGYHVHLMFLALPSPEMAVARVAERVRLGGHDVPEGVVRRRFFAGLRNFFVHYEHSVDTWQLFDSARPGPPALIAVRFEGEQRRILAVEAWSALRSSAHE